MLQWPINFLANDFNLLHQLGHFQLQLTHQGLHIVNIQFKDKDLGAGPEIRLIIIIILVQGIGCSGEESAIGLISEETSKRFRF